MHPGRDYLPVRTVRFLEREGKFRNPNFLIYPRGWEFRKPSVIDPSSQKVLINTYPVASLWGVWEGSSERKKSPKVLPSVFHKSRVSPLSKVSSAKEQSRGVFFFFFALPSFAKFILRYNSSPLEPRKEREGEREVEAPFPSSSNPRQFRLRGPLTPDATKGYRGAQ